MIEKSKLLSAILKRSPSQVQECLLDGADVYFKDEHGRNFLHLAVYLKSCELVDLFLGEGIDPNEGDLDKITPLHRACRNGYDDIADYLIQYNAYLNAEAVDDITPLHVAAAYGHTRCVQILCQPHRKGKINLESRDKNNHTALHYAANDGHLQTVAALIKLGCDVNAENTAGNRPLHFAATSATPDVCGILVQNGAHIDAQNINGQTALHMAIQQACVNTVIQLLNIGADPNICDAKGNTCSHLAIKNGHIEMIKILMMDSRTDSSISDNEENTVLHVALKLGHFNLIPMMLPRARDLTRQDANGCSVIIEAIRNQLEDLAIEMLHTNPSLVHTATNELVTPLHLAAERGMTNLTKQLLIAGAQVDAHDASGLTPSLYCAKNDSVLECLAMIEDLMVDNNINNSDQEEHVKEVMDQQNDEILDEENETLQNRSSSIKFRNYIPQTRFLENMAITVEKAQPSTIKHHIEDKLALSEENFDVQNDDSGNKYRINPEMLDLKKVDYDLKRRVEKRLNKLERETRKQIDKHIKEQRAVNKRNKV